MRHGAEIVAHRAAAHLGDIVDEIDVDEGRLIRVGLLNVVDGAALRRMIVPEDGVADDRAGHEIAHAAASDHVALENIRRHQMHAGRVGCVGARDREAVQNGPVGADDDGPAVPCLIPFADVAAEYRQVLSKVALI
ncbi:MAG: hypothetical protein ACR650_06405 [Methylocystis sp.]